MPCCDAFIIIAFEIDQKSKVSGCFSIHFIVNRRNRNQFWQIFWLMFLVFAVNFPRFKDTGRSCVQRRNKFARSLTHVWQNLNHFSCSSSNYGKVLSQIIASCTLCLQNTKLLPLELLRGLNGAFRNPEHQEHFWMIESLHTSTSRPNKDLHEWRRFLRKMPW